MSKIPEWPKSRPIVIRLNQMPEFFSQAELYGLQMINVLATEGESVQIGTADASDVGPGEVGLETVIPDQAANERYWDFIDTFLGLREKSDIK